LAMKRGDSRTRKNVFLTGSQEVIGGGRGKTCVRSELGGKKGITRGCPGQGVPKVETQKGVRQMRKDNVYHFWRKSTWGKEI